MGNVHIQMQKLKKIIMVLVSLHWAKFTALQIERFIFLSFILTHVFLKSDFNHSKLKSYSVMRCWIILLDFVCCLTVTCHHCDTINAAHTLNHGSANKIPNWDRHTLSMDAIRFNQHSNALQCSWYKTCRWVADKLLLELERRSKKEIVPVSVSGSHACLHERVDWAGDLLCNG